MKVEFYNANPEYIDYLKKYETSRRGKTCVPNVQYASKNNKFFYGTVLQVNGVNYFVPVSHQIHRKQDDLLIKVKSKSKPIVGTLRFAYMIPIPSEMLSLLRRDAIPDHTRQELVRKELAFCRKSKDKIEKMAKSAYSRIISKSSKELSENSCDFSLLEQACILFCKERGIQIPHELQEAHPEMFQDRTHGDPQQAAAKTAHTISRAKRSDIKAQAQRAGHTDKAQQRGAQTHSHDDELS